MQGWHGPQGFSTADDFLASCGCSASSSLAPPPHTKQTAVPRRLLQESPAPGGGFGGNVTGFGANVTGALGNITGGAPGSSPAPAPSAELPGAGGARRYDDGEGVGGVGLGCDRGRGAGSKKQDG